jgi:hypothetical protein
MKKGLIFSSAKIGNEVQQSYKLLYYSKKGHQNSKIKKEENDLTCLKNIKEDKNEIIQ